MFILLPKDARELGEALIDAADLVDNDKTSGRPVSVEKMDRQTVALPVNPHEGNLVMVQKPA